MALLSFDINVRGGSHLCPTVTCGEREGSTAMHTQRCCWQSCNAHCLRLCPWGRLRNHLGKCQLRKRRNLKLAYQSLHFSNKGENWEISSYSSMTNTVYIIKTPESSLYIFTDHIFWIEMRYMNVLGCLFILILWTVIHHLGQP